MLDRDTRTAILRLHREGNGVRAISRAVGISRKSVKKVLVSGDKEVPQINREFSMEPYLERVRELHIKCKSNMVRVQEELFAQGIKVPYSTLTRFCREHDIGVSPKKRAGQYHFEPGEEMQHDTSPHDVIIGNKKRRVQCASLVLCFSRMMYSQVYPTFNRFYCKVFLTEALKHFGGAARRCMIDNTNVVIARGTGKNAVVAPEMKAFADRFGFVFEAHEVGDANRSARVEGPFYYIENNFYAGRTFKDFADLNNQLKNWCQTKSHRLIRTIRARPIDLYQTERAQQNPLPKYVPDVYALHSRIVTVEGYANLHTNRYSVPAEAIGRKVQVKEYKDKVQILDGHKLIAQHERKLEGENLRITLEEHKYKNARGTSRKEKPFAQEEKVLNTAAPELGNLVQSIRKNSKGRAGWQIKRLYRFYLDYPKDALCKAVKRALQYGLTDLDRIERMVLKNVAGDFFKLPITNTEEGDDNE